MPRGIFGLAAIVLAAALALAATACKKAVPAMLPPAPEVVVADVIQRDVPLYSEWVGTTEGFVNAQIHPKVSGYLLKQNYGDGDKVSEGQLLFQIDDREYRAAPRPGAGHSCAGTGGAEAAPAGTHALHDPLQNGGYLEAGV
jgi:multidrug efflux pump subunit AcrA (membrane-fusion protein)